MSGVGCVHVGLVELAVARGLSGQQRASLYGPIAALQVVQELKQECRAQCGESSPFRDDEVREVFVPERITNAGVLAEVFREVGQDVRALARWFGRGRRGGR